MSQGIYTRQSTDNPTGFRPWGYKLSGLGCQQQGMGCNCAKQPGLGRPRTTMMPIRRHRFSGLGTTATTPDVGTLQTQANNLAQQLVAMNADMMTVQTQIQALNAQGVDTAAEAALLLQQRNDFESIVSQFTTAYRALFGTTPPGLSALGIDPLTLAGIAAALAVVAGLIAVWWQHENALNASAQAKLQQQQNIAAALAVGDQQTASILASQTNPGPTDFPTWLANNWMYIALAVGGVIVLQKI